MEWFLVTPKPDIYMQKSQIILSDLGEHILQPRFDLMPMNFKNLHVHISAIHYISTDEVEMY